MSSFPWQRPLNLTMLNALNITCETLCKPKKMKNTKLFEDIAN